MSSPSPSQLVRSNRMRAVLASTVGTSIEWYDFFLYGTAAALVFPTCSSPRSRHVTGILLSFGTQFVGFAARPIGAAIFGHFGDRIGRKATLIATLLLMGIGDSADRVSAHATRRSASRPRAAHPAARAAGHRRRRRVGRVGAAVHGVGHAPPARLHGQLAADRVSRSGLLLSTGMVKLFEHVDRQRRSTPGAGGSRSCSASCSSRSGSTSGCGCWRARSSAEVRKRDRRSCGSRCSGHHGRSRGKS